MCRKALPVRQQWKWCTRKYGFAEDMFVTKKCVFGEKKRCDPLDIQVQNLVHKQDLCTIQKKDRESYVSILKRLYLLDISCGTWEAVVAVTVNHCRRHLCCVAVSHCCCRCPCRQPLPSPSPLAIAVAIAVGHHYCNAVSHFWELLPWRGKNCIQPIEAKNAYLIIFCSYSGWRIDQSRMTDQVSSSNGQHKHWAASGKQWAASEGSGWQQGGSRGAEGWRHLLTIGGVVLFGCWGISHWQMVFVMMCWMW